MPPNQSTTESKHTHRKAYRITPLGSDRNRPAGPAGSAEPTDRRLLQRLAAADPATLRPRGRGRCAVDPRRGQRVQGGGGGGGEKWGSEALWAERGGGRGEGEPV
ncbi:hypothetical protein GUJ93_ZPchr0012g19840 [Zizania palustris]|uniref:Uncharacterized protein n=1 Tax=Zizania palustris TaxID=103762 RepID=A0A8J5WT17_ZIZPA|nr:hypothetical protein GUJ93_ZPchr0012g19840 [Zizania palustris]